MSVDLHDRGIHRTAAGQIVHAAPGSNIYVQQWNGAPLAPARAPKERSTWYFWPLIVISGVLVVVAVVLYKVTIGAIFGSNS